MNKFKNIVSKASNPKIPTQQRKDEDLVPSQQVIEMKKDFELYQKQLKECTTRFESYQKQALTTMETERSVGDIYKETGVRIKERASSNSCLEEASTSLSEFHKEFSDNWFDLNNALQTHVYNGLRDMNRIVIKNILENEKKHQKVKEKYDNSEIVLKKLNEKTKVDINKVNVAEGERNNAKKEYLQSEEETLRLMKVEKERLEIEMLARLIRNFEEHYDFFARGITVMKDLIPEILEYRNVVDQRSREYEEENGYSLGELLPPKSTKLLYTSPYTQHEAVTENDDEYLQEEPRKRALEKIILHERAYVNNLTSISNSYFLPLSRLISSDPKVKEKFSDEMLNTIFFHTEEFLRVHQEILSELSINLQEYPKLSVGKIFLDRKDKLLKYQDYAQNLSKAQECLSEIHDLSQVHATLKKHEKTETRGSLAKLLACPMSHFASYQFLFETLQDPTPTKDSDFKPLDELIDFIDKLHTDIAGASQRSDELLGVIHVQKKIGGCPENLTASPDRALLHQGNLAVYEKIKGKDEKVKEVLSGHYCFLMNDCFVVTTKSTLIDKLKAPPYKFKSIHWMSGTSFTSIPDTENVKYAFEVKNTLQAYAKPTTYVCTSEEEKQKWLGLVQKANEYALSKKIFGVDLQEVMEKNPTQEGRVIPDFVDNALKLIRQRIKTEGIWRINGGKNQINEIKIQLDQGKTPDLASADVHTLTSLIRYWLREMPNPLLHDPFYEKWIQAATKSRTDPQESKRRLKLVVSKLPAYNKYNLDFLIKFLAKDVCAHTEDNKMYSQNLATVFSPNIIFKKGHQVDSLVANATGETLVVDLLIQWYDDIFEGISEERKNFEEELRIDIEKRRIEAKKKKDSAKEKKLEEKIKQEQKEEEEQRQKEEEEQKEQVMLEEKKREKLERAERVKKEQQEQELERLKKQEEEKERRQRELHEQELQEIERRLHKEEKRAKKEQEERERLQKIQNEREQESLSQMRKLEEERYKQEKLQNEMKKERERLEREKQELAEDLERQREMTQKANEQSQKLASSQTLCAKCSKPITDKGVNALNQKWHLSCFVCFSCNNPFEGSYAQKDGKPYCVNCLKTKMAPKCGVCSQDISGQLLRAGNQTYHPSCFVCVKCKGSLSSGFFDTQGGKICKNCGQ